MAQVTRAARRFPELGVPGKPLGTAGAYDVTDDWTPIYDRTERDGFFVAIGTSGNQFKNAPIVGGIMSQIIKGEATLTGTQTGRGSPDRPADDCDAGLVSLPRQRPTADEQWACQQQARLLSNIDSRSSA